MSHDTSIVAIVPVDVETEGLRISASRAGGPIGLSWRHVATVSLLLLTLPVFAFAAVASLPVLLVVGCGEALRRALSQSPTLRRVLSH